jgi:hypothetical protein
MPQLRVQVVQFFAPDQPGVVECEFLDFESVVHRLLEKIPVVTTSELGPDSNYPQPGNLCCEVLERIVDPTGRTIAKIRLDGVETTDGQSEFMVWADQID